MQRGQIYAPYLQECLLFDLTLYTTLILYLTSANPSMATTSMNRVTANQYRLILNISDQSATTEKGIEEPHSAGNGKNLTVYLQIVFHMSN
jgi:hypothetical protein